MSVDTAIKIALVVGVFGGMCGVFTIESALSNLKLEVRLLKSKVEWLEKRLRDG